MRNPTLNRQLTIPSFQLPSFITALGRAMPQWPHSVALAAGLTVAAGLKLMPADSLVLLENRSFLIEVSDVGSTARFTFRRGVFQPLFSPAPVPDLILRAKLAAFLQLLMRQEDPDTLFFRRELSIEGDTELGLAVKNMLDAMEWPRIADIFRR